MSEDFSSPPSGPSGSPRPNYQPTYNAPDGRREPTPRVRLGWAVWALLFLLVVLILPTLVEQIQYASTRGKELAQAEVAKDLIASGQRATISDYRTVVKAVQPSVVGVKAARTIQTEPDDELSFFFGQRPQWRQQDQGSGVIVDPTGYIITNYHVVDHATEVTVELSDGSPHSARIIGADPATDLAVLKISKSGVMAAPWGDSSAMEVGDPVLAIGNPFGLAKTVTAGILSATGRHAVIANLDYQDFLQTDAAVNPGNSGGPLVNMKGEVVGINTAIVGPTYQGISFAIPSNLVKQVYGQLVKTGKVARGWLGVAMQPLTPELAEKLGIEGAKGVLISGVVRGSPAEEAGLKPGDVIIRWNGKPLTDPAELGKAAAWMKIGEDAKITILRDGKEQTVTVQIGERPEKPRQ
jgi:serine protease Do